jgi:hypothetical protein
LADLALLCSGNFPCRNWSSLRLFLDRNNQLKVAFQLRSFAGDFAGGGVISPGFNGIEGSCDGVTGGGGGAGCLSLQSANAIELITTCMNEAARELGTMDPDDPRGAALVAELSQLMQLRRAVRLVNDPLAALCMDELAREMTTLKRGDPRRAQIVQEIMWLSDALHPTGD